MRTFDFSSNPSIFRFHVLLRSGSTQSPESSLLQVLFAYVTVEPSLICSQDASLPALQVTAYPRLRKFLTLQLTCFVFVPIVLIVLIESPRD